MLPRGIITVLNTPFTASDEVDVASLRRNVARAIEAGVAGFLVPAMASEVSKLSERERHDMVAAVVDEVNGKVPVIGGTSAPDREARVRIARDLVDTGVDGILASVAYENEGQFLDELGAMAAVDPGHLMVQDWSFTGYGIPVPTIVRAFETIDAFTALKIEVVPAGVKYSEVLAATGGKLHLSGGWAVTQMIEGLDRGIHAFMPTGLHATYARILALHAAGDRDGATTLFRRLLPVIAFSNQHLDISIHFFKRLLHAQGVYTTPRVREPVLPFDAVHERHAAALIELAMIIEAGVPA